MRDDTIIRERENAEGHDLLREMRVGPFVRIPLGEELERGARVIDLVEVHVARPVQPIAARREDGERHEKGDDHVAASRDAAGTETRRKTKAGPRDRDPSDRPCRVGHEHAVASEEPPGQVRGRAHHHQSDADLATAAEERRFDERRHAQIDVLLVTREREVERDRERDRERGVRDERPPAGRRERQKQRERGKQVALVGACRKEVERHRRERGAGEEHRGIATPPERNDRGDESGPEQQRAVDDDAIVRLPEVVQDRPEVERVQRRVGIRLGRAAHERAELVRDP